MGSINHLSKFFPNAASLTDKLRPLIREENEKKMFKKIQLPVQIFEWGDKHSLIFDEIKEAVARIAQTSYYNPLKDTGVKCDAIHSGLGATLEHRIVDDEWVPIALASRYLKTQEKKFSTK